MRLFLTLGLAATLLAACSTTAPEEKRSTRRELTKNEASVVEADNRFGLDLFRRLAAERPDSNVFISPISVSMALGMTLNGAAGETEGGMRRALQLEGVSKEEINAAYRGLIDLFRGLDPDVRLDLANSIWHRESFNIEQSFVDLNRASFDAEVRPIDFSRSDASATINGWVKTKTQGLIASIVPDRIPAETMMYLINAIYFKGAWRYRFDPNSTKAATFRTAGGGEEVVSMMHRNDTIPFVMTPRYRAVELLYGAGDYSMVVVLPNDTLSVQALADQLDVDGWNSITAGMSTHNIFLALPKFRIGYEAVLNDALTAMGMDRAFTDAAEFTGIHRNGGLKISQVRHKSVVEVNEEGTEAAAVTSVDIVVTSAPPSMIVDRPFLFAIRERSSGAILFIGKIMRPN